MRNQLAIQRPQFNSDYTDFLLYLRVVVVSVGVTVVNGVDVVVLGVTVVVVDVVVVVVVGTPAEQKLR